MVKPAEPEMKISNNLLICLLFISLLCISNFPIDIYKQFEFPSLASGESRVKLMPEIKPDFSLLVLHNMKIDGVRAFIPIRKLPEHRAIVGFDREKISYNIRENQDTAYPILGIFEGFENNK